jgi:hypothetical protein
MATEINPMPMIQNGRNNLGATSDGLIDKRTRKTKLHKAGKDEKAYTIYLGAGR